MVLPSLFFKIIMLKKKERKVQKILKFFSFKNTICIFKFMRQRNTLTPIQRCNGPLPQNSKWLLEITLASSNLSACSEMCNCVACRNNGQQSSNETNVKYNWKFYIVESNETNVKCNWKFDMEESICICTVICKGNIFTSSLTITVKRKSTTLQKRINFYVENNKLLRPDLRG